MTIQRKNVNFQVISCWISGHHRILGLTNAQLQSVLCEGAIPCTHGLQLIPGAGRLHDVIGISKALSFIRLLYFFQDSVEVDVEQQWRENSFVVL